MKNKLDSTKQHLEEKTAQISVQQQLTDKITSMKARIEAYANKKEAVSYLSEHVTIKHEMHVNKLESVKEDMETSETEGKTEEESERYKRMKAGLIDHTERVEALKAMMKENEENFKKREQVKLMLEKQVLLGEKRAAEQTRITEAREKLLALKMRELELQKAKLARKKVEQEEKERATDDFFAHIDKQLEEMESTKSTAPASGVASAAEKALATDVAPAKELAPASEVAPVSGITPPKGAVPKQKRNKSKGKGRNRSKSNTPKVMSPEPFITAVVKTPKVMSPAPKDKAPKMETTETKINAPKEISKESKSTEAQVPDNKSAPSEKIEVEKEAMNKSDMSEPIVIEAANNIMDKEASNLEVDEITEKIENNNEIVLPMPEGATSQDFEERSEGDKMTEEEVKEMVAKVEGKCQNIRGDIADMAMSEQYLRTKQALLMAKKKEQEMKIAEKMATIREEEVKKMKLKVQHMQDLLMQRKEKLQITEELMVEKEGEKKNIDKQIEATKRRENYVENQIMETVMFEKPPKKK
eukprot:TRINITY_DN333_c0_g1_i6.p1 TRINITY_DN333_c0_g1~~TRINITY_DN333_c0_g1_i6.p1  ORF type:complete len:529 (-),score=169.51 TRINITY_DN333_c0_g1_i6:218-1804(-)